MLSEWMSVADLHALASARFSSPACRARSAAFLLAECCGHERSHVRLRWQLNAVEISAKVFDQKLDSGPGMHDIELALHAVAHVHGFRVLAKTQQGAHLVIKLSATIERMDAAFARARKLPALKSTLQAMTLGLLLWFLAMTLYHRSFLWFLEEREDAWEVEDEV